MGYTTKFDGFFTLDKPLFDSQVLYLLEFARTRRVKRNVAVLQNVPAPARFVYAPGWLAQGKWEG